MLAGAYTRAVLAKRALHAEFYSLEPSEELWADALKLHWGIKNEDDDVIDCIVNKYGCEEPDNLGGDEISCDFEIEVGMMDEEEDEFCDDLTISIDE